MLDGIGKVTEKKLNSMEIFDINDLLHAYPKKYELHTLEDTDAFKLDTQLSFAVTVKKPAKVFYIRKRLTKLSVTVEMDRLIFNVHIFNREFLAKQLVEGQRIVVTGKFVSNFNNFTASGIVLEKNYRPGIIPVYNIKDINDSLIRKAIKSAFDTKYELIEEIPASILKKRRIPDINQTIRKIHFPETEEDIAISQNRIKYEELLDFALKVESLKKLNQTIFTPEKKYDIKVVKEFIEKLPFVLTEDQKQATNDIFRDLKKNRQMNRLLQGDVGSGKTIVSVLASLAVCTAGYQVAYMAPTLVLANQHYETFKRYFKNYPLTITLLTSELSTRERNDALSSILSGETDIIIGTHSLIQDDIGYHKLGFIVIDEQHRFGVEQRKQLRKKGVVPDILLMSATPIPRTLAISLLADIDVSSIMTKPAGRKPIVTDIVSFEEIDGLVKVIIREVELGHQAYFICPLIEESENSRNISLEELLPILKTKLPNNITMDVLHGKMKDQEKQDVLRRFYMNETNILLSTTVVEVGVNVQNATVMAILNANAFGLAQLHQLRGRIGRNVYQSYCYLIVDEIMAQSERLDILKQTDDGFEISEYDLKIRGPGEMFGFSQSGIPNFSMANIITDKELLEAAFQDATEIINSDDVKAKILTNKSIKLIESYNLD